MTDVQWQQTVDDKDPAGTTVNRLGNFTVSSAQFAVNPFKPD
jgi:hypothetical protein